jgi:hypothetical protein
MVLYGEKDLKIIVGDIETLACLTDLGFYDPDTKEWHEFQMSAYRNDLFRFVRFYQGWDFAVGYNYKAFDAQVIQYIIENHQSWFDKSGLEVAQLVYAFTQKLIDNTTYGLFPPYRENRFTVPILDVYLQFGLDNEARRSSLKKCEFQIDYPSVEEMPIHHTVKSLTEEQVQEVCMYRRNDVLATFELLKIFIGDTTHPIYEKNNQLEMRVSIQEEFGIECLNFSDIKIGDEILKKAYAETKKMSINDLPKKGTFRKEIVLKKCIPDYVSFETDLLKKLHKSIISRKISQTEKVENKFTFYGTEYIQALGGLHSVNRNEKFEEDDTFAIHDYDVASMYPAIIVNNGYFPKHLGKELLDEYSKLYHRRVELKPLSKRDKKVKGIVDGLKLALNAVFGKLGSMESWLYDKQTLLSVTLTGQFCLLMLIEAYELAGFHVISANTDGVTVLVKKGREEEITAINKKWEERTQFILEKAIYKKIIYSTVNDYIALTDKPAPDDVKVKGDFIKNFELWKNKSSRIIPLALEQYFIYGKDPVKYVQSHDNIYDFCIMGRATGQNYLELQKEGNFEVTEEMLKADGWHEWYGGTWKAKDAPDMGACSLEDAKRAYKKIHPIQSIKLKKLVRYYLSDDSEWQLYKRGTGTTGKAMNVNQQAPNAIGNKYIKYFNQFEEKNDYKVAHKHYILKVLEMMDALEKTKKVKSFLDTLKPQQQLTLF